MKFIDIPIHKYSNSFFYVLQCKRRKTWQRTRESDLVWKRKLWKIEAEFKFLVIDCLFSCYCNENYKTPKGKKQGYPISIHEINLPLLWLAVPFLPPPLNPIFISPGLSFLCRSFILFIDVFFTASEIDGYTHRPAREHVHNRGIPSQRNGC